MTGSGQLPAFVAPSVSEDLASFSLLPAWLRALDDPHLVREALVRADADRTAAGFGAARLTAVRLSRVRLRAGRWTAVCRVVPDRGGPALAVEAAVSAPSSGDLPVIRLSPSPLPEPDPELPTLARLLDPDGARTLLVQALGGTGRRPADLRRVRGHVARHRLGDRCTLVLRLETATAPGGTGWPDSVVAKTYHRPDMGRNAWAAMRAAWASPLSSHPAIRVAEPLAWLDGQRLLLQEALPHERTLRQELMLDLRAGDAGRSTMLRAVEHTGAAVAALHGCGVHVGGVRTWSAELRSVRGQLDELTAAVPALAGLADPVLDTLDRAAADEPDDPLLPAHGSLRPTQVLVGGDRVAVVDFDGFGRAEPAHDVGLFRATARDVALAALLPGPPLHDRLAVTDRLVDAFLRTYRASGEVSSVRVRLWEALALLTAVLHSWTKVKPDRLGRDLALLRHLLRPAPAER